MAYSLASLHDMLTGVMVTAITIAYLKSRSRRVHPKLALVVLTIFFISLLPSPLHGIRVGSMLALIAVYVYLYKTWDEFKTENWEIPALALAVLILMAINIVVGLRLTGVI